MVISPWMTLAVFGGFLFDWLALFLSWEKIKPLSKATAMLLVILFTVSAVGWHLDRWVGLILCAQEFGLLGDIFLLLKAKWFKWGLASFLIGHFFYLTLMIAIFSSSYQKAELIAFFSWWVLLALLVWLTLLGLFYGVIREARKNLVVSTSLWKSMQVYAWVLSGMVAISFLTVISHPYSSWQKFSLFAGSGLFLISDFLLTYHRFVRRVRRGQLLVRITYHLAQINLAWGLLLLISN